MQKKGDEEAIKGDGEELKSNGKSLIHSSIDIGRLCSLAISCDFETYSHTSNIYLQSVSPEPGSSLFLICSVVLKNLLTKFFSDQFFMFP